MEKRQTFYWTHLTLLFIMTLLMFSSGRKLHAMTIRETDVSVPQAGNVMVEVPGTFEKADIPKILKLINGYRKEACSKGYPNPNDESRKLTMSDYSEVKWSGDLEWIAQTRAAEGSVYQSHGRPGGSYDCSHNGVDSWGECLAWNYSGLIAGIQQWYEEKDAWVKQSNEVTGHYTSMINPSLQYIGIGCFSQTDSVNWTCVAGAFSYEDSLSQEPQGTYGKCYQKMEVIAKNVNKPVIEYLGQDDYETNDKTLEMEIYSDTEVSVKQYVTYPHIRSGQVYSPVKVPDVESFDISDQTIARIDQSGKMKALKEGTTSLQVHLSDGTTLTKPVKVVSPLTGRTFTVNKIRYMITSRNKSVTCLKTSVSGKLVIPATVRYADRTYKVTSVYYDAFRKNKKITSVVIGSNVKRICGSAFRDCKNLKKVTLGVNLAKIGKNAFYNCSKLKSLTISSRLLKADSIGSGAFSRTKIKKVKCPKGKKKAYKKILRKKGVKKSAKFK